MQRRALFFAGLLLAVSSAALAADVTGTWQVTITSTGQDGSTRKDTGIAILNQTGNSITGSLGPDAARQNPVTEGMIKDDKVILKFSPRTDRTMTFELTINGDKMVGMAERTGGDLQKATVEFVKRQN
ncbi:MAG TPA: hypothetical protein VFR18_25530 [Terriglobia bacterium]|nr:hypothetical protein [Terriglobia bacterium]